MVDSNPLTGIFFFSLQGELRDQNPKLSYVDEISLWPRNCHLTPSPFNETEENFLSWRKRAWFATSFSLRLLVAIPWLQKKRGRTLKATSLEKHLFLAAKQSGQISPPTKSCIHSPNKPIMHWNYLALNVLLRVIGGKTLKYTVGLKRNNQFEPCLRANSPLLPLILHLKDGETKPVLHFDEGISLPKVYHACTWNEWRGQLSRLLKSPVIDEVGTNGV